ncbi:hypothetical protein Fmac_026585 [Flemingia macrophylla]|uniref:Clu domain-containing protein n=1 Tax=Flemingia macrophylla TaxID=520843 RepID=A0ABD1LFG2_9FABA
MIPPTWERLLRVRSRSHAKCMQFDFGNLPYGFRANTWVVPPVVFDNPSVFPLLLMEDETWGGNGGRQGRDGKHENRQWARDFAILAAIPCQTAEERQIRDSLFVDVSVFKAVSAIKHLVDTKQNSFSNSSLPTFYEERIGDLTIKVTRDVSDASLKSDCKNDGNRVLGLSEEELAQRNLLKGITADESATVHDTPTLGAVLIRHCGYTTVTTLQILQAKLGSDDLRTQDAAAWLEYFELEQHEAARNGTPKPDASISSKGHLR